jgi:ABC-type dipeptide/oligopeptide/nickel transport system permease subunit
VIGRFERATLVGAIVVAALVVIAIVQPGGDPLLLHSDGLSEVGAPLAPSEYGPLGTDHLGRDVWSRLAAGAGTSLAVASLATLIALVLALVVGLTAGYAGGWIDGALMRVVDLVLAFPFLLLAILLAALLRETDLRASMLPVVLALAITGWTVMARMIRSKARSIARSEMIVAARALGASPLRIVMRHVLPNLAGVLAVVAILGFAQNLLAEATLSFLGLGPPPPAPTWGRMLYEGRTYYRTAPHLVLAPGLAILVAVVAFQLLGDGLRTRFVKERA